jgi:hypothetical protein
MPVQIIQQRSVHQLPCYPFALSRHSADYISFITLTPLEIVHNKPTRGSVDILFTRREARYSLPACSTQDPEKTEISARSE